MTIIVDRDDTEHNAIYLGFEGDWGWLGLRKKLRSAFALMRNAPTTVDLIFGMTYAAALPPHAAENFDRLRPHLPANLGTLVLIAPNSAMRAALLPLCDQFAAAGIRMVISATQTDVQRLLSDMRYTEVSHAADEWR